MRAFTRIGGLLIAAGLAAPVSGHHGFAGIFDMDTVVALRGTVSRYDWRNPHVYIYLEAPGRDGAPAEWQLEGDPTPIMTRSGWSPTILQPGDPVTVRVNPDRNAQRNHALLVSLTKDDGVFLTPRSGGTAAGAPAASIEGVWDGLPGFATRRFSYGRLTEAGAAARAAYTEADNPTSDCVPFPLPTIVAAPYLYEIEILDDRVLVRSELYRVQRTFYTDGRGHPENGEPTNQGHSIAWWEDDVLVVDTTLYAANRSGNRDGIPSGARKHSVERYRLSEDRTQLLVDYVIEDPEYMVDPMTGSMTWNHAPGRVPMPFDCDPENARLYELQ